jgi:hypothetical protein
MIHNTSLRCLFRREEARFCLMRLRGWTPSRLVNGKSKPHRIAASTRRPGRYKYPYLLPPIATKTC